MKKIFYIQRYAYWKQSKTNETLAISFIPPLLRRRLTNVEKIGLFLAHQLEPLPENCQIVFASRFGEWQQTIDLIEQFFHDKEMSPAGFSHSVHNAMPGLLSILTKNKNTYTSIAAQNETIENGLIEAFCEKQPVLFIYAEEETPAFYKTKFKEPFGGHGIAFIISDKNSLKAQKILVDSCNQNQHLLTFQKLCSFLDTGEKLTTNHFILRKEK